MLSDAEPRPGVGDVPPVEHRPRLQLVPAPGASATVTLGVEDLGLRRGGRWLFRGMAWSVRPGELLAVTGPSGSGKSSLVEALAGLAPPDEGRVLHAAAADGFRSPAAAIGLVAQRLHLSRSRTLLENVLCGRLGRHPWWRTLLRFPRADRELALGLLARLGLGEKAQTLAFRASGGEQQRTALARALAQEPAALVVDEPVSQLDPAQALRVLDLLRGEAARGLGVVCVLHDPHAIRHFADRVLRIDPSLPQGWSLAEAAR